MARTSLSSISVPFLILLIITFTFFAQRTPISAVLKIRKLGSHPSPPPPPSHGTGSHPALPPPSHRPPPVP
ncbi:hypothetical protein E2542_SST31037 [Spatholobus suberectus]|nr:hypothetical protein E2542_SST31037 [Spatholobus suberectus]